MMTRTYADVDKALAAFIRLGKTKGWVLVLGGGWWQVTVDPESPLGIFRAQGYADLKKRLLRRASLTIHPDGSASFTDPKVVAK